VEDKATFIKKTTAGKSKFLSLEYKDPSIRVVGDVAIVRCHWLGESETIPDGKKSSTNPDELAKTGRRMETIVSRVHQTLTVNLCVARGSSCIPAFCSRHKRIGWP
jgi:hypothetical protein